jgi:hypothetical protein
MSNQTWDQTVITATGDGGSLSNSSVATSLLPTSARWLMPANFLYVGSMFRFTAAGRISNIVTSPGLLTLDLRLGGTVVFNGGAMQLSTTAHTTIPWYWEGILTARAIGASANFMGQGKFSSQAANISGADPTTGHSMLLTPNTTPAVGTNFDSTGSLQWDLFATFGTANAGNLIQLHQFGLEAMN